MKYSTIPGTSRHHWGTDIDIIDAGPPEKGDVLLPQKFHDNGPYNTLREWMETHAKGYGFLLPYNRDENRTGFKYEPWHYTYKPVSNLYNTEFLKLDLKSIISKTKLAGKEFINEEFIKKYIKLHLIRIERICFCISRLSSIMFRSSTNTFPEVGEIKPVIIFRVVLFPAPLPPNKATIFPLGCCFLQL